MSGCRRAARAAFRTALLAHPLDHSLAADALELGVQAADPPPHLVRHGLLLLARGLGDRLEEHRLPVLDGHLRELEPLPVARLLRAVDRDGDDGRARLEREAADAPLGLVRELTGARPAALAVHDDRATASQDPAAGDEGLLVVVAAAHWEDPSVVEDPLHDAAE